MSILEDLEVAVEHFTSKKVFHDDIPELVKQILSLTSHLEECTTIDLKVRWLLLRSRACLLLPNMLTEAENSLHKGLKLKPTSLEMWFTLSECLHRRHAHQEALDALENILRIDPKNKYALRKISQVLRDGSDTSHRLREQALNMFKKLELLFDEKEDFASTAHGNLDIAVAVATKSLAQDLSDGESWSMLGLALMQKALYPKCNLSFLQRALTAMERAKNLSSDDPDILYNYASLLSLLGEFGQSSDMFLKANQMDPKGLHESKRLAEKNQDILLNAENLIMNNCKLTAKELSSFISQIPISDLKYGSFGLIDNLLHSKNISVDANYTMVRVLEGCLNQTLQPVTSLVIDRAGVYSLLLVHNMDSFALRKGDFVSFQNMNVIATNNSHELRDFPWRNVPPLIKFSPKQSRRGKRNQEKMTNSTKNNISADSAPQNLKTDINKRVFNFVTILTEYSHILINNSLGLNTNSYSLVQTKMFS